MSYKNIPSLSSDANSSAFNLLITQPIAENAFGQATRLKDKIIGIENDVIRYQIIEAYEDYLASLINTYYSWYSAYENLHIGEMSYTQNKKLLDNMNKRADNKIALPVDVNKIKLLVIDKEENVIVLQHAYENVANLIKKSIRFDQSIELIPVDPSKYHTFNIHFTEAYKKFTQTSRTYEILSLLEEKSLLEVQKDANALFPSMNLLFGYEVEGKEWQVKDEGE